MFLLEFLMFTAPGGGLVYLICRFVRKTNLVTVARADAAMSGALLDAARHATLVAEEGRVEAAGTALEALGRLGEALDVARGVELVHDDLRELTEYLVTKIEGTAPPEVHGRHVRPALPWEPPAIGSGPEQEEGWLS